MNIFTITERRTDIAEVWCRAVSATLTTPHVATVLHQLEPPACSQCATKKIRPTGRMAISFAMRTDIPKSGVRMFLEEDMIPVRPWSIDDYPGSRLFAEGYPGVPWPSLYIGRGSNSNDPKQLVPQRFVREGGCPDWLPPELCEPALKANAKVLGSHFVHLDKMYRETEEAAAKEELLCILADRLPARQPGLGDIMASALDAVGITKERVQAVASAVGVQDCGCKKRQAALNALGTKLGLPPGQTPPGS